MFQEMINNFNPMNFVKNAGYMGAGMLGIFVVIGLIVITTVILNKATSPKKDK
jgi:hypothetical protein